MHVDHGLRPGSEPRPTSSPPPPRATAPRSGPSGWRWADGPNLEARARAARWSVLARRRLHRPHRRRPGRDGAGEPPPRRGPRRAGRACAPDPGTRSSPLRRSETAGSAPAEGLDRSCDPSNDDPRFVRNRVRHEVLPLLDDVAGRDLVPRPGPPGRPPGRRRRPARRPRRRASTPPTPGPSRPRPCPGPRPRCGPGCVPPATASRPTAAAVERVLAVAGGEPRRHRGRRAAGASAGSAPAPPERAVLTARVGLRGPRPTRRSSRPMLRSGRSAGPVDRRDRPSEPAAPDRRLDEHPPTSADPALGEVVVSRDDIAPARRPSWAPRSPPTTPVGRRCWSAC